MKNALCFICLFALTQLHAIPFEHSVYLPAEESEFVDEYVAPCCQAGCPGCRKNNPKEYE